MKDSNKTAPAKITSLKKYALMSRHRTFEATNFNSPGGVGGHASTAREDYPSTSQTITRQWAVDYHIVDSARDDFLRIDFNATGLLSPGTLQVNTENAIGYAMTDFEFNVLPFRIENSGNWVEISMPEKFYLSDATPHSFNNAHGESSTWAHDSSNGNQYGSSVYNVTDSKGFRSETAQTFTVWDWSWRQESISNRAKWYYHQQWPFSVKRGSKLPHDWHANLVAPNDPTLLPDWSISSIQPFVSASWLIDKNFLRSRLGGKLGFQLEDYYWFRSFHSRKYGYTQLQHSSDMEQITLDLASILNS